MARSAARVYRAFIVLCMVSTANAALVTALDALHRYNELLTMAGLAGIEAAWARWRQPA